MSPRKIVTPGDNPFTRHSSVVDTRSAILLEHVDVVTLENPSDGRTIYGLELEGKVNRSSARSDVLYLFDADGAASIVSELIGLMSRSGPEAAEEFQRLLDARLDALPKPPGAPDGRH